MIVSGAPCRICGSTRVTVLGAVEYLHGFNLTVFDCRDCECRFTPHDATVHNRFHQDGTLSYYNDYAGLAARCQSLFAAGDAEALRSELERWPKYRFIIDRVSRAAQDARVLEIGSSRGYLTAYFILTGRQIRGVDISPAAVEAARATFGDHFAIDAAEAYREGPFDIIYHVGLVGCVADPIGLTRALLARLKPGGILLFNAPNKQALRLRSQLWMDSAPPPDLVTLFPPGFWRQQFSAVADVVEGVETLNQNDSLTMAARELVGVRWRLPAPQPVSGRAHVWRQPRGPRDLAARAAAKVARLVRLDTIVTPRPAEFGLMVSMRVRPA